MTTERRMESNVEAHLSRLVSRRSLPAPYTITCRMCAFRQLQIQIEFISSLVAAGQAAVVAGAVHHHVLHVRACQRPHMSLHRVPALAGLPRVARAEQNRGAAARPGARYLQLHKKRRVIEDSFLQLLMFPAGGLVEEY